MIRSICKYMFSLHYAKFVVEPIFIVIKCCCISEFSIFYVHKGNVCFYKSYHQVLDFFWEAPINRKKNVYYIYVCISLVSESITNKFQCLWKYFDLHMHAHVTYSKCACILSVSYKLPIAKKCPTKI